METRWLNTRSGATLSAPGIKTLGDLTIRVPASGAGGRRYLASAPGGRARSKPFLPRIRTSFRGGALVKARHSRKYFGHVKGMVR